MVKSVCVFCGSSGGKDPVFAGNARCLGEEIARREMRLIYGGGNVGLMGVVADAALAAGGEVVGVIPRALVDLELAHAGVTQLHVVNTMHERKGMMADLADAFVALPGGFGTLDEFCEIITWAQLGIHSKPCGLLNTRSYYDPFLAQIRGATDAGFLRPEHRDLITVSDSPAWLLDRLAEAVPIKRQKWLDREDVR